MKKNLSFSPSFHLKRTSYVICKATLAKLRILICILLACTLVSAQPTLVKDINTIQKSDLSQFEHLVSFKGFLYFTAFNPAYGTELWKSDGTPQGTSLVKDITPGAASSIIANLIVINNNLFFTANTSVDAQSIELWKSDGTLQGTVILKDIKPGPAGSLPQHLVNISGTLFFTASDGVNGKGIWKSDGTIEGTELVKALLPDSAISKPSNLVDVNGTLFFTVGGQLWKTDGTQGSTVLVKEVGGSPGKLTNANGTLFFTAFETENTRYEDDDYGGYYIVDGSFELWKSDGTPQGTSNLKTIQLAQNRGYNDYDISLYPVHLQSVGNTVFFSVSVSPYEYDLYKSDGTSQGTVKVKYIGYDARDYNGYYTPLFTTIGNLLYFKSSGSLIRSDGTAEGTFPVKNTGVNIESITPANGKIYLTGTGNNKVQVWESNGTEAGTTLIKSIETLGYGTSLAQLTYVTGRFFFVERLEYFGNNGLEIAVSNLWTSDGTEQGTFALKSVDLSTSDASVTIQNNAKMLLNHVNGTLFFRANDGVNGTGLWKSDGTQQGTQFLKNVIPIIDDYTEGETATLNSSLYFNVYSSELGGKYQLWKSDGTQQGTVQITSAGSSVNIMNLLNVNGTLFFDFASGTGLRGLYKTDSGTGTVRVANIYPIRNLTHVNGTLFFNADNNNGGYGLWKSDGTEVGTVKLKDIPSTNYYDELGNLVNINGTLFFSANGQLWKSDGTPEGTVIVKSIPDNDYFYGIDYLTNINNTLFFVAKRSAQDGWELWKSDGTEPGTIQVKDINPSGSSFPMHLTHVNGTLFFTALDDSEEKNRELWKSDGTEAGTIKLTNYFVDQYYSFGAKLPVENLLSLEGKLYFTANNGISGMELWTSDGTTEGTILVSDIFPGPENAQISDLINVNGVLYFAANNGKTGIELWKYNPDACQLASKKDLMLQSGSICNGENGQIIIKASEKGISYQAYINGSAIGSKVEGGGDITLTIPAVSLNPGNNVFTVKAGGCTLVTLSATATIIVTAHCDTTLCAATGSILQELWWNVPGSLVSDIPVNTPPSASYQLTSFETATNVGNNYGQRIRGYLCVPQNGNYTFYIAGDDRCELWLSTDDDPMKKTKIASVPYYTGVREWNKYASQKSVPIALAAGKKYYIEALHKEGPYSDNLAVGWQSSPTSPISVIPGSNLSPYVPKGEGKISREYWADVTGSLVINIPLNTPPTTTSEINTFETATNAANNYGQRIRGYIHPQQSGNYTFYIAGDDRCELWLSTDDDPAKKVKIASVPYYTGVREWNKYSSQQSALVSLIAGRKYYIEALHKEGPYSDNLAVGWQLPSQTTIAVIAGNYLSPFLPSPTANIARAGVEENFAAKVSLYPNPFEDKLTLVSEQPGKYYISVVDNLGRTVYQTTTQGTQTELHLTHLKAGVYVVKTVSEEGKTNIHKVIKQ